MLTMPFFGGLCVLALVLVVLAPLYSLVMWDLLMVPIVEPWYFGNTLFDPSDLVIVWFGAAVVLRGRLSPSNLIKNMPYLATWLLLGIMLCVSYLASPLNAEALTNPARAGYQLYRYCFKLLLYYPICLLVLRDLRSVRIALLAMVVGANICAAEAVVQGYSGAFEPPGPFDTGNELAAVLIVPFMVALSGLMFPLSFLHRVFSGASVLLMARAILFSASRGGMVSLIAACGFFGALAFLLPGSRRKMIKLIPAALAAPVLLLIVRPDLLERPTVRHAVSLTDGHKDGNMQWRIKERWPHFIAIAMEHPLLGTGTYIDESLSKRANTPHNGYIAMSVKYGFITTGLFLLFVYRVFRDSLRVYRRSPDLEHRVFFLTFAASIVGLMTHNIVETTWVEPIIMKYFWLMTAVTAAYTYLWQGDEAAEVQSPASRAGVKPRLASQAA
ncbi:MAG: O-antigen ligase family protein [Acidobacteriota bacterium]